MSTSTLYRDHPVWGTFSRFEVVRYDTTGRFIGVMAGMGRNCGSWGTMHGRSTAYAHAAQLRKDQPGFVYRVEPVL